LGVHPTGGLHEGSTTPRHHAISSGPDDHGYGIVAMVTVPGADDVQLYQPRHQTAYGL